jgi:potassium efflux system protein
MVGKGMAGEGHISVTRTMRFFISVALLAVLSAPSAPAFGASPSTAAPAGQPAGQAIEPINAGEILMRADAEELLLRQVMDLAREPDPADKLVAPLDTLSGGIRKLSGRFDRHELDSLLASRLTDLDRYWKFYERQLADWRDELQRITARYSSAAADLARQRAVWEATRKAAVSTGLTPALTDRVREILSRIGQAENALSVPLNRQLELASRGGSVQADCDASLKAVDAAFRNFHRRLVRIDAPPLLKAWSDRQPSRLVLSTLTGWLTIEKEFLEDYSAAYAWKHDSLGVGALVLLVLLLVSSRRKRKLLPADTGDQLSASVLQRPISSWLVIVLIAFLYFEPDAPLVLQNLALILLLMPVLRLLPRRAYIILGPWPYVATGLYLSYLLGFLFGGVPLYDRIHLLVLAGLALPSLLLLLLRMRRQAGTTGVATHARAVRFVGWLFVAGLLGGVVANVAGNVSLARALTGGVIQSGYFGLALYAATAVFRAVLKLLLGSPSSSAEQRKETLLHSLSRLLNVGTLAVWVVETLKVFFVFRPVTNWARVMLSQPHVIGHISITVGSILLFVVSVWVSLWLAKTIRFTLRDEMLPRMEVPQGVGDSITTLIYYALATVGFMIALVAAGFQLSQLTLAVGALGVGIGFGLQSIARDIVSGVVLLYERPLRVGDWVEVANLLGVVTDIGIRASRVRTRDGAEVVVPNGELISGHVANWTLSDRRHRVHVDIGVAYGTDPEKVLDILMKAAQSHPDVLVNPAPRALFKGFGDSSLDFELRVWTQNTERGWQAPLISDLSVAINKALAKNGIEVPFPQRDLHLRSISPEARADLGGPGPRPAG